MVKAREKRDAPRQVRRDVRCLCDTPDYLARETLSHLTGRDESVFTNMTADVNATLLIYTMGGDAKHKVALGCDRACCPGSERRALVARALPKIGQASCFFGMYSK